MTSHDTASVHHWWLRYAKLYNGRRYRLEGPLAACRVVDAGIVLCSVTMAQCAVLLIVAGCSARV